jgi:hypothetical protein
MCGRLARGIRCPPNHRLSILRCRLRFRRGCLSLAWPFPRLCSSSVTNSTDFLLLFGSGRIALAPFLAFLTQLLLVQISLELFIGKTTAETSGGNCQCRSNFYWPPTGYHMPRAFRQRIAIRKRKLTTTRSTLMRHNLSYRDRLTSSNAEVATCATSLSTVHSSYLISRICADASREKPLKAGAIGKSYGERAKAAAVRPMSNV